MAIGISEVYKVSLGWLIEAPRHKFTSGHYAPISGIIALRELGPGLQVIAIIVANAVFAITIPCISSLTLFVLYENIHGLPPELLQLFNIIHGPKSAIIPKTILINWPSDYTDQDCSDYRTDGHLPPHVWR